MLGETLHLRGNFPHQGFIFPIIFLVITNFAYFLHEQYYETDFLINEPGHSDLSRMNASSNKWNAGIARPTLTSVLLFTLLATGIAQKSHPTLGLGIEAYSSGNSLGTLIRPYLGIELNRNFFSAGIIVQKQSGLTRGAKIGYSRNLSSETEDLRRGNRDLFQINLTCYLQYTDELPMSNYAVNEQYCVSRNNEIRWENLKLSTAEAGAGVEIRININRNIAWRNSTAMAFHYHTDYTKGLYRERSALTLGLNTGLLFRL